MHDTAILWFMSCQMKFIYTHVRKKQTAETFVGFEENTNKKKMLELLECSNESKIE